MASRILPAQWFRWSDGSRFTAHEEECMKLVMRKKSCRLPGENTKQRFFRVRDVVERHKAELAQVEKQRERAAAANLQEIRKELVS